MYIADFHADIADVCVDIAENHGDVRNFSQCPQSLCGHLGYGYAKRRFSCDEAQI